ncbi:uncharacterized protein LOC100727084 [Cavia porcellus]|uniref:uncharacterized protein LOC100727084 n=1 Tax=Cavia porcellus TaxID=10141 RepID=UPI002FE1C522
MSHNCRFGRGFDSISCHLNPLQMHLSSPAPTYSPGCRWEGAERKKSKVTLLWSPLVADAQLVGFRAGGAGGKPEPLASLAGTGESLSGPRAHSAALRWGGGEEGAGGTRVALGARGGGAAVSLSAPEGPRPEGGSRVSMAPGLRGPRAAAGAGAAPVSPRGAGPRSSPAAAPRGLAAAPARPASQAAWVELPTRPPRGDAPRGPRSEPRAPTSARRAQLLRPRRTCGFPAARCAVGRWPARPALRRRPRDRGARAAAAGWPPGSALQLQPGMLNVSKEQQLSVVGPTQPCVRYSHTWSSFGNEAVHTEAAVLVMKEGLGAAPCIDRRTALSERQTVHRCFSGWSQWDDEPGCLLSIFSVGSHSDGRKCSDGEVHLCQYAQGFHGSCRQYGSCCGAQAGLDLTVSLLPQLPEFWDYSKA